MILAGAILAVCAALPDYKPQADALKAQALKDLGTMPMITDICGAKDSPAPASLVSWAKAEMEKAGLANVQVIPGKDPAWQPGAADSCLGVGVGIDIKLTSVAIPGSPGTPKMGLIGEVIPVRSLAEAKGLGDRAKGSVLFFDGTGSPDYVNGTRFVGESVAESLGAAGVMVRSTGLGIEDVSKPSSADFSSSGHNLPTAVVSAAATAKLLNMVKDYPGYHVEILLDCKMFPPVSSSIVAGQITGTENPKDVILLCSHLDSLSKMPPTRNDGVGAFESIEALRLMQSLGWKPKKTVRVAVFVDEAPGGSGAQAYAASLKASQERTNVVIDADEIGFEPKAYHFSEGNQAKFAGWQPALAGLDVEKLSVGGDAGPDAAPFKPLGAVAVGLEPKSPRYFDYHRMDKAILAKFNPKEIEAGAASLAMIAWLLSEEGAK